MTSKERKQGRYERRNARREAKRNAALAAYDDFNNIADADNLFKSFLRSRRGVSWKESVQRYEAYILLNIAEARRKLLAGESVQSGFVEFILNERGKTRHIKSVHISERVVQKCLCDYALVPLLSRSLIYDNGASIKGKGIHFAIKRLVAHLASYYRCNEFSNEGYALVIDFSKFFDNIDHSVLFKMLETKIRDKRVLELAKKFISVFGDGKSLGLGSQVSQISAIFYPDKLDHFIKEKLRVKYYGRYMDDLYLIHCDRHYLQYCLNCIKDVCLKLGIKINEKKTRIVKLEAGFQFLKGKYILKESGQVLRLPCKESAIRMRRKLKKYKRLIDDKRMSYLDLWNSYQSWRGNYRRRFNAYHRIGYMDKLYNDLFINIH